MSGLQVFAGSYEHTLFGYEYHEGEAKMQTKFIHPAHAGIIKSVTVCGKYLVSGGDDDTVRIYHREKNIEFGNLALQQGTVNTLRSFNDTHVVTGTVDGTVCVWATKDWEPSQTLHSKSAVLDLDIHPSGRVVISAAADRGVRLWDLTRARCIHKRVYSRERAPEVLRWQPSEDTDRFAAVSGNTVAVYGGEGREPIMEVNDGKPALAMCWVNENLVASGGEGRYVTVWDIRTGKDAFGMPSHANRIKAITVCNDRLFAADSAGVIAAYDARHVGTAVSTAKSGARLTCLSVAEHYVQPAAVAVKAKASTGENVEDKPPRKRSKNKNKSKKKAKAAEHNEDKSGSKRAAEGAGAGAGAGEGIGGVSSKKKRRPSMSDLARMT